MRGALEWVTNIVWNDVHTYDIYIYIQSENKQADAMLENVNKLDIYLKISEFL